ncbi:MAG: phosphoribosylformylglycinamidine cyclo-ligase [Planctomycetaceae bacterium]|nr:phosphoribosylformylglycinamidine cyclo-ligase [Planctomycetaceae bacterium]
MTAVTYKSAGIDLEQYEEAMGRLPALMRRTHSPRVMPLDGGFAGLFRLMGDGRRYDDPVLVSGTDGVGTKLKVAMRAGRFDTVGIDLVAMCVNDCLCCGAEPLFFLDYLALPKDDPELIEQLVAGVSEGCVRAQAALIGGETAIMPDLYAPGEFDMAGFCVGVVERNRIIDGAKIAAGDLILGVDSSGLHSNGYSLVRKVVFELAGHNPDDSIDALGTTVAEALLTPTRIYTPEVRAAVEAAGESLTGIAHITGGGLVDNIERLLPEGLKADINRSTWTPLPVFGWLQKLADIDTEEMFRVFNMGIGLALIVRPDIADAVQNAMSALGTPCRPIGRIAAT